MSLFLVPDACVYVCLDLTQPDPSPPLQTHTHISTYIQMLKTREYFREEYRLYEAVKVRFWAQAVALGALPAIEGHAIV